jgi:tetratricopeptide (TPR) repeat protein
MHVQHKPEWSERLKEAQAQFRRGDFGKAEKLYERALASAQEVFGERSSHTAIILSELAECFDAQGKEIQAEECYGKVRGILQTHHQSSMLAK